MTVLHLCLVSDQLPANLIPALKLRPDKALLLASERMQKRARMLKKLLIEHGVAAELWPKPLADNDIRLIEDQALEIAEKLDGASDDTVVLNATGGNKLMTIGFWQVLSSQFGDRLQVLYCDTQHDSMEYLLPERRREALGDVLDLKTYLAAYGYRIVQRVGGDVDWHARVQARKRLTKWLGKHLHRCVTFLGTLNGAAADAARALEHNDLQGARQAFPAQLWGFRLEAMREIANPEYGLADWQEGDDALVFKSLDAARYLSGGWMEEYAFHCAHDQKLAEVACSVRVRFQETETENEIDVAAVFRNRLLVIECKTASFHVNGKDFQDVIHKLDNVGGHVGGLFAERWLLSVRTLPEGVVQRARSYGIQTVHGKEIAALGDRLRQHFQP